MVRGDSGRCGDTERSPGGEQFIDPTVANEARVYDALLGGTDNFAVDREVAALQAEAVGGMDNATAAVRANRVFLGEVVRWLTAEAGIRQFLDIGSGLPSGDNVHQVAQRVAPESRVVYVDYDPIVMAHAHELLEGTSEGATEYVQADFRDPDTILDHAAETLDFNEPTAVLLVSFLHFFPNEERPQHIIRRLLDAMASGSYLALSHLTADMRPEQMTALVDAPGDQAAYQFVLRTKAEIEALLTGLEPMKGGVVPMADWLPPDVPDLWRDWSAAYYCGLGRKP